MGRILRENGLSIVLFGLFFLSLLGQSITGLHEYNEDQLVHRQPAVGYVAYLRSGHFIEAVFENWESEFLQMGAYVLLTVFLFQKGSSESKEPDTVERVDIVPKERRKDDDTPWPVRRGGWVLKLYENSLSIAFRLRLPAAAARYGWARRSAHAPRVFISLLLLREGFRARESSRKRVFETSFGPSYSSTSRARKARVTPPIT